MSKKIFGFILIFLMGLTCQGQVSAEQLPIKLESAYIDPHNAASIERGAQIFAKNCMVCHSLKYLKRDPFALKAGISVDKMPVKDKQWWFGAAPPDLTLAAKVHGPDWLYTYLHVFYQDPTRPTGSNNLLVDNSNMPNPFVGIQGQQELVIKKSDLFETSPPFVRKLPYYTVLQLTSPGSYSPDEFDNMTRDLVNFLVYASEPKKYARESLGIYVLLFIAILWLLVYLLKQSYWKNIHKD